MKRIPFPRLRIRLILIVLLAVIPALGLTLYSGLEQRRQSLLYVSEKALKLAKEASSVQEPLIENARHILLALSQMPEVHRLESAICSKIFNDVLSQTKGYTVLFATKPNGDVFASALPITRPINFADRPWYHLVKQKRQFVIGEYQISRITGKATIALGYPVFGNKGQLKAIIAIGLDLIWLSEFMAKSKPSVGTSLSVIDRKGTILARYPDPEKLIGKSMPETSVVREILGKEEGWSEAPDMDGKPHLFAFTSLGPPAGGIYVCMGIPKSIAFAEPNRTMVRNFLLLGIVTLLALIAAWFVGGFSIVNPVNRLLNVTERLAEGDFTIRSGPRYDRGEIGLLARSFDQMAESLQRRETERRQAEGELSKYREHLEALVNTRTAELRRSEERFRMAAESVSDLTWEWDIVKGELGWFGKIDEMLGYRPGEFPRTIEAWEKIIHPDDHDRLMSALDQHLQTRKPYLEQYRVIRKDGAVLYWSNSGTALWDEEGKAYKMIGTVTDITDRKRMDENIRLLATVVRNSNDAVTVQDFEGRIISWNRGAELMYGYSEDEAFQMTIWRLMPARKRTEQEQLVRRLRAGETIHSFETQRLTKEGRLLDVWLTVTKLVNDAGTPVGIASTERDITERKRTEEVLKKTIADMERSNKELEQFAYVASHDLQEPLRMVESFTQLLAKRYKDKLDADANEFISYAVDGANRMQKMINDLLSYSRVGARGKPFEAVGCTAILNQALTNLRMAIEGAGAMITHDPLPTVMGDESQLVQLFQNLIDNAIKFRREEEPPRIHISAEDRGNDWFFSIKDNGIGIDPQYNERIFIIFQRLHRREEYPGTGIGLTICKKIVERHGGRVWVDSQPGNGSTFYFTIPKTGGLKL